MMSMELVRMLMIWRENAEWKSQTAAHAERALPNTTKKGFFIHQWPMVRMTKSQIDHVGVIQVQF